MFGTHCSGSAAVTRMAFLVGVVLSGHCVAQAPNELDFDRTQLPLQTIPPNGATHQIIGFVAYTDQNLELNAPLVVTATGELRLVRSVLRVRGSILMQDGARITVIDSDLLLPNAYPLQYELRIEGGLLHTERATIGSDHVNGYLSQTRFLHLRGTWLARHTVIQGLVTLLSEGRQGWFGNPLWKGGSVVAKGLFEGERADAVHLSGMGDATLEDGTMNVGFAYDAGSAGAPINTTIDLNARAPLTVVYGDPGQHAGVTAPITGHACRLELRNHRSPTWQFTTANASQNGPLNTITLRNTEDIICNFRGSNIVGSPVLAGPWSNHYSVLPGLPSTERPGFHALPPGCSVRLGNVQFQSGPLPTDWNKVRSWGLYVSGTQSNLTVTGPTLLSELQLTDGQVHLSGTGSHDMRVHANTVRLYQTAVLTVDNASLGDFGIYAGTQGLIEANDSSTCTLNGVRTGVVTLHVASPSASITAQNVLGVQNLTLQNPGNGTLQVVQASPTQNTDLQNLGFELPLLGGAPQYWSVANGSGALVPGAAGGSAYQFTATAPAAAVRKQLVLPPETLVTLLATTKVTQNPASGQQQLSVQQGANSVSAPLGTTLNTWRRTHVPLLTTGPVTAPVTFQYLTTGAPAGAALDDARIVIGSWWDEDNLGNLGFEGEHRYRGAFPNYLPAPDCWVTYSLACTADSGAVRPGALPGSRSTKATLRGLHGDIYKQLTFLRAGDTVVLSGWARGTGSGAHQQVIVGNGPNFYVVAPPNQFSSVMPCNGAWQPFSFTYVVPPNPSFTRVNLGCFGPAGSDFWFDDITVSIQ